MPLRYPIFIGLVAALLLCAAAPLDAQGVSDGTLHVLRPVVHAEQEEAELCLEFDHDLNPADHDRIASLIKLESGGKKMPVKPQNISVIANLLCLPSLEHHREYRIAVTGVRGAKDEKLASPYGLVFTVPDRQPSLTFTGGTENEGLTRWQDANPVLRSVNVPHVHLELFRIADPALMAAAWRDRQQTTLAPSESATFGHDHGQVIWSGDLVFGDTLNKTLEQEIPLQDVASHAPPGLYLIVARAPEAKTETASLATTGAAWLLRSGLRLRAVRDPGGFYGLAEKSDASAVLKDVRLLAEDANGQTLAEIRSDAAGVGFLPLVVDAMKNAAVLAGFSDAGDADFVDLNSPAISRFIPPENDISLTANKAFYLPAEQASVTLVAHDARGHATPQPGSTLALMWPEGGSVMSLPVPADKDGIAHVTFSVPARSGEWLLEWRKSNGDTLAQMALRVSADPDAPRMEMTADRAMVSRDGDLNLTLKSSTADGNPVPYVTGRVFIAWAPSDNIFREWKDFHFGNGGSGLGESRPLESFVTDEKGAAFLHVKLTPPDDGALLHNAILSVRGDTEAGVAEPPPLTFSLKPKEGIIGIKPLAAGSRFPENGFARFAVIALDAEGHRRSADDLAYQIYEEGRSFDWYQAEGRWNYKPLQQKRRIGGGVLVLGTGGEDVIEWPVTAGTYRLEITDANGVVRASLGFSAGWGLPETMPASSTLPLTSSVTAWRPGQEIGIRFTLERPSMIDALIGDDHIRTIIHQFSPAGENKIAFTPDKEWNDRLTLRVEAEDSGLAGQVILPRGPETANPLKTDRVSNAPPIAGPSEMLAIDAAFPPILRMGDIVHASVELTNNGATSESWHYLVSVAPGLKVADAAGGAASTSTVKIPAGQSRTIPLTLNAIHTGSSAVKLDVTGPSHFHITHEWAISIVTQNVRLGPAMRQRIEPQQSTSWPPDEKRRGEKTRSKTDSLLFLSSTPLVNAPVLLADILGNEPFATSEITGVMETLRLWRTIITAAELLPEIELDRRERNLLMRLLVRQKPDGGFSSLPQDQADFISTSQAVTALTHVELPVAKPALEQAAGWLRQRLENTWFDEQERPARAAAYAALAEAGHLDNANLHYFSDTSALKTLPPLAAVQLAFAFAKIGDQPASSFWIDRSGVFKGPAPVSAAIIPVLAANAFVDPQSLWPSLEVLSNEPAKDSQSEIESVANILRAIRLAQTRKGTWHVTVNTDKRDMKDILVMSVPAKTVAPMIRNTGNDPLFLTGMQKLEAWSPETGGMKRHIYQLNGTEISGPGSLVRGETYLTVLEGAWPNVTPASVLVHDDLGPALRINGCLPPPPIEAADSLAWLKSQTLTGMAACETSGDGIDMLLTHNANDNAISWRVAYLAKAQWGGLFNIAPASVHILAAGSHEMARTAEDRIDIR